MKWGLGDSYDSVQYLPSKIRAYADLTKPASSIGVTVAFFLASLFYFYYNGEGSYVWNHIFEIVYTSITVLFAHGASQAMNMAEDADMDSNTPHKQNRPIPSGIVTVEEARALAWMMAGFALVRGFMVSLQFGMFVMSLLFLGIFYNLEPIRAKSRSISVPWQAVSRGLMSFPLVWAAYGDPWKVLPWTLGLIMFFYVLGFQNSADIIDRDIDEQYGIKTFVVMFGVWKTIGIAMACVAAMEVVELVASYYIAPVIMMAMSLMIVPCYVMLVSIARNPYKISPRTGNHPSWLMFYGGFIIALLLPLGAVLL